MPPTRFCIVLDNPTAIYFPGQVVSGKVDLWLTENVKIKAINLEAKGEARVHWTETRTRTSGSGRNQRTHHDTVHFNSDELYYRQRFSLLQQGGESFFLPAGNYQYPFSFQLPFGLPSSFEGEFGYVRYTIKIVVHRPWKFNYEAKAAIAVNSIYDLNAVSLASESAQGTDSKTICCWCCASGPISARVWIDKMGYVPGQSVPLCAEVENHSGREMLGSKVQLIQITTFHARNKSKIVEKVLGELQRGPFGESELWDHVPIGIPPVPPTSLPYCNIINIDYRIEFTVNPGTFALNLKIPLNIIIGNVPLRCYFSMFNRPATSVNLATDVPPEAFSTAAQYTDLPPPSYEEAVFKGNIREEGDAEHMNHGGTLDYAPRYLTYQMNL